MTGTAISPSVVRITGAFDGRQGEWECVPLSSPAREPQVIGERQGDGFIELVLDTPTTPGARYVARCGTDADVTQSSEFIGYLSPQVGRLDLYRTMPVYSRRTDTSGDLRKFMACLQDAVDLLVMRAESMTRGFDGLKGSARDVEALLRDRGNPFAFPLSVQDARRLCEVLVPIYRQKGTGRGITNAIRLFLGLEVKEIRCHIVTKDDSGIIVGGADRKSLYTFDVEFAHPLTDAQRQRIVALVEYMKPAHTHLADVLSPSETPPIP